MARTEEVACRQPRFPQRQRAPQASYENWGATPGMAAPVPGAALSAYRPGMCWKVFNRDWQNGQYVPCSQFRPNR